MSPRPRRLSAAAASWLLIPLISLLVACGQKPDGQPGAQGAAAPPPPEVGVITVKPGPVALTVDLPGRLEASRVAEVRARVAGILEKRLFEEGSDVEAGQPLFQIAAAPYEAAVASARASVARAQANLTQASAQVRRYKPLLAANAVSRQDYDNAVAAEKLAEADVAVAKANLQTSQINLGYASVTSPIAGRIGRALVTEGALVGQGEVTELAVVQQIDPMYVNFTQSTAEVLRLRRAFESGTLKRASDPDGALVHVVLEDGTIYDKPGKLLFADLTVDPTSGQVTLRAQIPNQQQLLLPGMYVRVRFEQAQASSGILLPQQAVTRSSTGDTVMVVAQDGKVSPRHVRLGPAQGSDWVVFEGLAEGEQVIVDGFQKMRPNTPVKPVPWKAPDPNGAAAAGKPANGATAAAKSGKSGDDPASSGTNSSHK
jgi:membrane fusion protein (multidrug efflux system)